MEGHQMEGRREARIMGAGISAICFICLLLAALTTH
jgi:hypothetical protein